MPLPHHVSANANRFQRSRLGHWLRRRRAWAAYPPEDTPEQRFAPEAVRADAHTRTFWARGADHRATLVEASAGAEPAPRAGRVAELLRAHHAGDAAHGSERPRGNPAFSEALFVELMRARQYGRAFAQLSVDSQRSWGSVEAFAAAQAGGAMRRLRGVSVKDVRYLPEWEDRARGTTYREVAELSVEYTLGEREGVTVLPRIVHLVPDRGRWRSLCYPM
jgi:hypothetical protein